MRTRLQTFIKIMIAVLIIAIGGFVCYTTVRNVRTDTNPVLRAQRDAREAIVKARNKRIYDSVYAAELKRQ